MSLTRMAINSRKIFAYMLLALLPVAAGAQTAATLSIEDFALSGGETKAMLIDLTNPDDEITLVQFDLALPEGVIIAEEGGEQVYDIAGRTTWRKHSLNASTQADGSVRFLLSSGSNASLEGYSGAIVSITLMAASGFSGGDITLKNQLLVCPDAAATTTKPADYTYTVTTGGAPPSAGTARLSIEDFTLSGGETKAMLIDLTNPDDEITLVQFDLALPEGVIIAEEGGEQVYDIAGRTTWRKHSLNASTQADGSVRFLLSSGSNASLEGNSGAVVSITLMAASGFSGGDITLKNQLLVCPDAAATTTKPADYTYTVMTGSPTPFMENIDLKEGWNWVSVNVGDDWSAGTFLEPIKNDVERMLSQTQELVNDPVYNFVGNLTTLSPAEGFKLKMGADANLTLKGEVADISTTVSLKQGWNWLGYLPTKALAVETALSGLQASDGDRIVSQDGFAEYQNGTWSSSFGSMEPGKGYMYYSAKDVTFCYPADEAVGARIAGHTSQCANGEMSGFDQDDASTLGSVPHYWEYDVHRYPDVTTIIGLPQPLQKEGGDIAVAAFCGEECRGVGRWVGDKLFITVHGTSGLNEAISFRAYDLSTGEELPIVETINFQGQSVGSLGSPMLLHMQESNGIEERHSATAAYRYYAPNGRKLQRPQKGVNIIVAGDGSIGKIVAK